MAEIQTKVIQNLDLEQRSAKPMTVPNNIVQGLTQAVGAKPAAASQNNTDKGGKSG